MKDRQANAHRGLLSGGQSKTVFFAALRASLFVILLGVVTMIFSVTVVVVILSLAKLVLPVLLSLWEEAR